MSLVGFEPTIPASYWPQAHALDHAATGIGFSPRTVEPVASRYTDCAIWAPFLLFHTHLYF